MRKFYIFISILCCCYGAQAQQVLKFRVSQPPILSVDPGEDKEIKKGESIVLGGEKVAEGGVPEYSYLWTPSNGLDRTDVANPTASPDTTTTYTLTVTDNAGCSKISQVLVIVQMVTGLGEWQNEVGLKVYPNPNDGTFFITSEKHLIGKHIIVEVLDLWGKIIYQKVTRGINQKLYEELELKGVAKGIYILKVRSGSHVVTKRIIVY